MNKGELPRCFLKLLTGKRKCESAAAAGAPEDIDRLSPVRGVAAVVIDQYLPQTSRTSAVERRDRQTDGWTDI